MKMVNRRRRKVERLERELDALRKHITKLFESFSVPTFPEGTSPSAAFPLIFFPVVMRVSVSGTHFCLPSELETSAANQIEFAMHKYRHHLQ